MMNKKIIRALLFSGIILLPFIIYRIFVVGPYTLEFIFYIILTFLFLIFGLIFKKKVLETGKKMSFDKGISILGLVIALVAFIEANRQANNNNIQFEENRKASENLFNTQLDQEKVLNNKLLVNSNGLNERLVIELNKIKEINENLLMASIEQQKLANQSLEDYIFETRANLSLGKSKIIITDTLDTGNLKIIIIESISNVGKRIAKNFEIRQSIVFNNGKIGELSRGSGINEVLPSEPKEISYPFIISKKEYENFYYWVQIRYYDERLDKLYDRSKYFHFYKTDKGYDFYYVNLEQKNILRKVIDNKLSELNLSLTVD